jgi:hypothetical protein
MPRHSHHRFVRRILEFGDGIRKTLVEAGPLGGQWREQEKDTLSEDGH